MELVALKAAIGQIRQDHAFSERRACGLMTMAVSSYRYQTKRSDEPLRTRLGELAREKARFGYRWLHVLLGRSGEHVNHKRVHRVYREAGLMIRRKSGNTACGLDIRYESGRRRIRSGRWELDTPCHPMLQTRARTLGQS